MTVSVFSGRMAPVITSRQWVGSWSAIRAAPAGKNGTLYLVGTVSERGSPPRQLQNRLASQLRRSVQVESTTGSRYQVRVPLRDSSEARQMAVRLAGLGVSHSRVVVD